jgi:hypothetical protein
LFKFPEALSFFDIGGWRFAGVLVVNISHSLAANTGLGFDVIGEMHDIGRILAAYLNNYDFIGNKSAPDLGQHPAGIVSGWPLNLSRK